MVYLFVYVLDIKINSTYIEEVKGSSQDGL